ncbi:hypothetical protein KIL84_007754 [Mauremys mutica]|uniref:Uncharacterized protein n=1 Tax=Mauremys mutica TaxID=74926 RepID=A0A9D3X3E6_9SAUR|nr:hypothetical protein KIL84_007754 [Mauremys mutica]
MTQHMPLKSWLDQFIAIRHGLRTHLINSKNIAFCSKLQNGQRNLTTVFLCHYPYKSSCKLNNLHCFCTFRCDSYSGETSYRHSNSCSCERNDSSQHSDSSLDLTGSFTRLCDGHEDNLY